MILYRTPNLIFGDFEWHASVVKRDGRTRTQYYFRPLTRVLYRWRPITSWSGKKPPLWKWFAPYRRSINKAMESETLRAARVATQPVGVVRRLAA